MSSVTSGSDLSVGAGSQHSKPTLDQPTTAKTVLTYLGVIALGLGFVAWSIFRDLEETGAPIVTYLPFVLLGVALLLCLFASRRLSLSRPVTFAVNQLKSRMSVLLRRRSFAALAVLGLLNGLLPCGLVYVACAGAAATGGTMAGASYMTAFGIGTVPMMLANSLSGKLVPPSLRLKLVKTIPVCVFLLGTLLILRGMSLGIPYLSPDMSGTGASCCHK